MDKSQEKTAETNEKAKGPFPGSTNNKSSGHWTILGPSDARASKGDLSKRAISVYRELLERYAARNIGLYGTSAGAVLGAQMIVRLRSEKLTLPAAGKETATRRRRIHRFP